MTKLASGAGYRGVLASVCACSLFFLGACTIMSHGRMSEIRRSEVEQIQIGKDTKSSVVARFGQPQRKIFRPDGVEVHVFTHGIERSIALPFLFSVGRSGGGGQTLVVTYKNGIVVEYEFTIDQRRLSR